MKDVAERKMQQIPSSNTKATTTTKTAIATTNKDKDAELQERLEKLRSQKKGMLL